MTKQQTELMERLARECANKIEGFAWDDDGRFVQRAKPEIEAVFRAAISLAEPLVEALRKISACKNMTRLADCCVEKTCHINADSDVCSFQTGVHYANADRAGDADEALSAWEQGG